MEYARRYGQGSIMLGASMEFVTLRAIGIGRTVQASLNRIAHEEAPKGAAAPPSSRRRVQYGRGDDDVCEVAFFDGQALQVGQVLAGPALIDGADTTIWIPRDMSARVDARRALNVEACT
jgi:N-methylhydantoinase A